MKAYNNKFQTNYTGRTFFEEVFVPLFFDHPKYMMTAGNSPLENPKLSWEDMIKGKKPFETAERRKERIDKMINKIESEKADASIAIGDGVVLRPLRGRSLILTFQIIRKIFTAPGLVQGWEWGLPED